MNENRKKYKRQKHTRSTFAFFCPYLKMTKLHPHSFTNISVLFRRVCWLSLLLCLNLWELMVRDLFLSSSTNWWETGSYQVQLNGEKPVPIKFNLLVRNRFLSSSTYWWETGSYQVQLIGEKPVQVQLNSENWFLSSYLTTEDLMSQFVEFLNPTLG